MSVDHDYAFSSTKKPTMQGKTSDGRPTQMMGGQVPNGSEHRIVQRMPTIPTNQGNIIQRQRAIVQQSIRSSPQYGVAGSNGMSGTIAGRASQFSQYQTVRQIVQPGQQLVYQRQAMNGNQTQQRQTVPITYASTNQATKFVQVVQQQSHSQNQQGQIQHQNYQIIQHQPQMPQQPQIIQHQVYNPNVGGAHLKSMNLAVPLREPSPEPIQQLVPVQESVTQSSSNQEPLPAEDEDIDIQIRNVVCNYTLPLHIDLKKLAMNTNNVTYEREKGVMMKQKRNPNCYIKVYSSGKVYIVGCNSENDCRRAARSIARHIQRVMGKVNERVAIRNYRINNVLATCRMPFGIKIEDVFAKYPRESTYEPELSVGLVWRSTTPKATLRIHTTGSITVTGASSEADVLEVLSNIYPIVLEFRCQERAKSNVAKKRKRKAPAPRTPAKRERFDDSSYGSSGVINNKVYFSDEDEDLYDDLDLDE